MTDPTWRPTRRNDAFDVMLAVIFAAVAGVSLHIATDPALYGENAHYHRVGGILSLAALTIPLAVRRRFPVPVLVVGTIAYLPLTLLEVPEYNVAAVAYFIALYSAGAYGETGRHLARGVGAAVIVALVVWSLRSQGEDYPGTVDLALVQGIGVASNVFYLIAAWLLGDVVRVRREREETLVAQADALRTAQAERAERAVRDEQVRIARELHDVVAHHVSVMGVQAGAARHVLRNRPDAVPDLLSTIEASSRQAVAELQQMLRLLRRDDEAPGTDPQPTLARLDALVEQMNEAGLAVHADLDGAVGTVPPGVDLSAYRIVQEAMTNTLKHAGPGTTVAVAVRRRPGSLEIVVSDDGRPTGARRPAADGAAEDGGAGHGLVGMRERVALLGGELRTGRQPGGGFRVQAWLPLREGAS
jgi:signal transduction histidine kinase